LTAIVVVLLGIASFVSATRGLGKGIKGISSFYRRGTWPSNFRRNFIHGRVGLYLDRQRYVIEVYQ
jgi:hypothetical protein